MNSVTHRLQVLVSAASDHGSTTEIARTIGSALDNDHLAVDVIAPAAVDSLADYDAVILGSALYAGRWLAPARDFAVRFRDELAERPLWLFSSGPVGESATGAVLATEHEPADVTRIRQDIPVRGHRIFPGKLSSHELSITQRAALLVSRRPSGDFRDWAAVTQWADSIADDLTRTTRRPRRAPAHRTELS